MKAALRKEVAAALKALPAAQIALEGAASCAALIGTPEFAQAQRIGIFVGFAHWTTAQAGLIHLC